jgi:hypothetical protein
MQKMKEIEVKDKYSREIVGKVPSIEAESLQEIIKTTYDASGKYLKTPPQ